MLDTDDKKTIDKISFEQVFQAMEGMIIPRFDQIDKRLDSLDQRLDSVEKRLDSVEIRLDSIDEHLVEIDQDMSGVKYRLGEVEKKVETLIDSSVVIKLHERRISKLELAVASN